MTQKGIYKDAQEYLHVSIMTHKSIYNDGQEYL
jgi:hypothetical protein